jgi:hypothetical protein
VDHAARAELVAEGFAVGHHHVVRVVLVLRLFLGVQVVEVAEELVEAVVGRQVLVAVTEVVLAELASGVALVLEQAGDGRVFHHHAFLRARQADLAEPGTEHALAHDERRAAGGAGLLGVVVAEAHAFATDTVDVGRLVAHHAARVVGNVPEADVVAPEDEDVGLVLGLGGAGTQGPQQPGGDDVIPRSAIHVRLPLQCLVGGSPGVAGTVFAELRHQVEPDRPV